MSTKTSPYSFGSAPSYGIAIRDNPKNIPTAYQNYSSKGSTRSGPFTDRDFNLEQSPEPTSGTGANYRVVFHRRVKRKNGGDKINNMDQRALVMFTQKEDGVQNKRPKFQGEDFESLRLYTMLNLPAINSALEKRNLLEQSVDFDGDVMTVDIFAEKVYCEGVVTSERGGESNQRTDSYGDRLINNVIFGKCEVFNHWGYIVVGSKLFFIIKRCKAAEKGYNLDGSSNFTTRAEAKNVAPIQVIPWTKKGWNFPPLKEREYKDEQGRTQYGKVIYFGKVEKISPSAFTEKDEKRESAHDVGFIVNQALISVLIQPQLIS
jgi:hypothetical protein